MQVNPKAFLSHYIRSCDRPTFRMLYYDLLEELNRILAENYKYIK